MFCHRFSSSIRKCSKHLVDFPTPKFVASNKIQQWREILIDIYSHLSLTDESFTAALIDTGPRPFRLQCMQPWGYVPNDPDTSVLHHTAARADLISDILIEVRVSLASNTLTTSRWLGLHDSRRGTQRAAISLAERVQAQSEVLAHTEGSSFVSQPL